MYLLIGLPIYLSGWLLGYLSNYEGIGLLLGSMTALAAMMAYWKREFGTWWFR